MMLKSCKAATRKYVNALPSQYDIAKSRHDHPSKMKGAAWTVYLLQKKCNVTLVQIFAQLIAADEA